MKVYSLAAAALLMVGATQAAMAADLGVAPIYKAPAAAVSSTWSGFYIGGNAGGGFARTDSTRITDGSTAFPPGFASSSTARGPVAGGQVGIDFQTGPFVLGVVGSLDWANITGHDVDIGIAPADRSTRDTNVDWLTDVGGRVGYDINGLLPYVKGGGAWMHSSATSTNTSPGGVFINSAAGSETRTGWFIGGGFEYRFVPTASAFLEFDHYDFGTANATRTITAASAASTAAGFGVGTLATSSTKVNLDVIKVGLNWRPGWLFGGH
jgi:outer membrane immunogenic protein